MKSQSLGLVEALIMPLKSLLLSQRVHRLTHVRKCMSLLLLISMSFDSFLPLLAPGRRSDRELVRAAAGRCGALRAAAGRCGPLRGVADLRWAANVQVRQTFWAQ